jgi:hypothetical protein
MKVYDKYSKQYVSYEKYMLLQKIMWAIGVDRIEYDIKCKCYYTHHFSITLSDTKAIATPFNKQDYSYIVKRLK